MGYTYITACSRLVMCKACLRGSQQTLFYKKNILLHYFLFLYWYLLLTDASRRLPFHFSMSYRLGGGEEMVMSEEGRRTTPAATSPRLLLPPPAFFFTIFLPPAFTTLFSTLFMIYYDGSAQEERCENIMRGAFMLPGAAPQRETDRRRRDNQRPQGKIACRRDRGEKASREGEKEMVKSSKREMWATHDERERGYASRLFSPGAIPCLTANADVFLILEVRAIIYRCAWLEGHAVLPPRLFPADTIFFSSFFFIVMFSITPFFTTD